MKLLISQVMLSKDTIFVSTLQNLLIHGHLPKLQLFFLARASRVLTPLSLAAQYLRALIILNRRLYRAENIHPIF